MVQDTLNQVAGGYAEEVIDVRGISSVYCTVGNVLEVVHTTRNGGGVHHSETMFC